MTSGVVCCDPGPRLQLQARRSRSTFPVVISSSGLWPCPSSVRRQLSQSAGSGSRSMASVTGVNSSTCAADGAEASGEPSGQGERERGGHDGDADSHGICSNARRAPSLRCTVRPKNSRETARRGRTGSRQEGDMASFRAFRVDKTEDRQFPRRIVERDTADSARRRPADRCRLLVAQLQGRPVRDRQPGRHPQLSAHAGHRRGRHRGRVVIGRVRAGRRGHRVRLRPGDEHGGRLRAADPGSRGVGRSDAARGSTRGRA